MRIIPEMHKDLAEYAEANNESLNSAVTTLIERLVLGYSKSCYLYKALLS